MPDAPESAEESSSEDDEQPEEPPEEPPEEHTEEASKAVDKPLDKEEPKEHVTVVGGRRRGRRQVSKKKTIKDDEGYLGMCISTCKCLPIEPDHLSDNLQ